jgi:hypothetical protein
MPICFALRYQGSFFFGKITFCDIHDFGDGPDLFNIDPDTLDFAEAIRANIGAIGIIEMDFLPFALLSQIRLPVGILFDYQAIGAEMAISRKQDTQQTFSDDKYFAIFFEL